MLLELEVEETARKLEHLIGAWVDDKKQAAETETDKRSRCQNILKSCLSKYGDDDGKDAIQNEQKTRIDQLRKNNKDAERRLQVLERKLQRREKMLQDQRIGYLQRLLQLHETQQARYTGFGGTGCYILVSVSVKNFVFISQPNTTLPTAVFCEVCCRKTKRSTKARPLLNLEQKGFNECFLFGEDTGSQDNRLSGNDLLVFSLKEQGSARLNISATIKISEVKMLLEGDRTEINGHKRESQIGSLSILLKQPGSRRNDVNLNARLHVSIHFVYLESRQSEYGGLKTSALDDSACKKLILQTADAAGMNIKHDLVKRKSRHRVFNRRESRQDTRRCSTSSIQSLDLEQFRDNEDSPSCDEFNNSDDEVYYSSESDDDAYSQNQRLQLREENTALRHRMQDAQDAIKKAYIECEATKLRYRLLQKENESLLKSVNTTENEELKTRVNSLEQSVMQFKTENKAKQEKLVTALNQSLKRANYFEEKLKSSNNIKKLVNDFTIGCIDMIEDFSNEVTDKVESLSNRIQNVDSLVAECTLRVRISPATSKFKREIYQLKQRIEQEEEKNSDLKREMTERNTSAVTENKLHAGKSNSDDNIKEEDKLSADESYRREEIQRMATTSLVKLASYQKEAIKDIQPRQDSFESNTDLKSNENTKSATKHQSLTMLRLDSMVDGSKTLKEETDDANIQNMDQIISGLDREILLARESSKQQIDQSMIRSTKHAKSFLSTNSTIWSPIQEEDPSTVPFNEKRKSFLSTNSMIWSPKQDQVNSSTSNKHPGLSARASSKWLTNMLVPRKPSISMARTRRISIKDSAVRPPQRTNTSRRASKLYSQIKQDLNSPINDKSAKFTQSIFGEFLSNNY